MKEASASNLLRQNLRFAKHRYSPVPPSDLRILVHLTRTLHLSAMGGEIVRFDGNWYVTHSGLLRIASRRRCLGIRTVLQERQSDPVAARWVFKATVYSSARSRGFVGFGDADPSNVSPLVRGAEMRVAETRAVNRALRKAYGIGLCSVEELGSSRPPQSASDPPRSETRPRGYDSTNGHPRLRDQLSLLIRQHNLDPTLVKAYAASFCGTQTLGGASRDLIESFISHLAVMANENRDALVCKLNSYSQPQEVRS